MRSLTMVATIGLAAVALGRAQEPNPALVEARKAPLVEPKYDGKPRYLAIALGQPVHRVIWSVLDGTTLYVDRDGNGRVDGDKERLMPRIEKRKGSFAAETHSYDAGELPAQGGSPAYSSLTFSLSTWNLDYKPGESLKEVMEVLRANPVLRNPMVSLKCKGKPDQFAMTEFAESRATATVLHFDGPTSWGLVENLVPQRLKAGQEHDVQVSVGTPGLGAWSFTYTMTGDRKDLRPKLDVSFASGPKKHWVLPEWC